MKLQLDIEPFDSWAVVKNKPFVIAGPCSAETEEQVVSTLTAIAHTGKASVLRAGVWKPRTRPGEFEGSGDEGLKWLVEVKKKVKLPVTVEVANAEHTEKALKAGVDILWIGARSTVNPFTMQEIADALRGVDVPVMVKNPVSADLPLWCGGMERINKAGIKKMVAIHRGFTSYEKTAFRNVPQWDLIIQLKLACPDLPIICDPSHICGNRDMIPFICQKAIDLDMQGLMIETHIDPTSAWTDAKQQITPTVLNDMIDDLCLRKPDSKNKNFTLTLEHLRAEIDKIDDALFQALAERIKLVEKIADYKLKNNVTVLQASRFDEMMNRRKAIAGVLNLDPEFIEKLLILIHDDSINKQEEIMNAYNSDRQLEE